MIWWSLRKHLVPEYLIDWIKCLYNGARSRVLWNGDISAPYSVTVGVHQGSALSPLLFNLVMNAITADLQRPPPWCLLYADDVAISDTSSEGLQDQVQAWKDRLQQFGMKLNVGKTEYLAMGVQQACQVTVDGTPLPGCESFKYLGSTVSADGRCTADATSRASVAWCKWKGLTGVLCDKQLPVRLKSRVYKAMVRPVALYGSESRASTQASTNKLHCMEMSMLRWSLGLTRLDRVPNDTIRMVMGVAPIQEKIRERRLRWFGHARRCADGSVVKTALDLRVDGNRGRGRPKMRWFDNIKKDLEVTNLTEQDALDRVKWRRGTRAADLPPVGRINA